MSYSIGLIDSYPVAVGNFKDFPMYPSYLRFINKGLKVRVLAPAYSKSEEGIDFIDQGFKVYTIPYFSGPQDVKNILKILRPIFLRNVKRFCEDSDFILLRVPSPVAPLVEYFSWRHNKLLVPFFKGEWGATAKLISGLKGKILRMANLPWELYHERLVGKYDCLSTGPYLDNPKVQLSMFRPIFDVDKMHYDLNVKSFDYAKDPIVCIGRLSYAKGVDLLIQAFSKLNIKNELWIVGDGPERKTLEEMADKLAPGRIRFEGSVPHSKIDLYFKKSGLVVIPSRTEGIPKVMIEGLSKNKKIIAPLVGGIPKLPRISDYLYLFEVGNVFELKKQIEKALDDHGFEKKSSLYIDEVLKDIDTVEYVVKNMI